MRHESAMSRALDAALAQVGDKTGKDIRDVCGRWRGYIELPCWDEACVGGIAVEHLDRIFAARPLDLAQLRDDPVQLFIDAGVRRQRTAANRSHLHPLNNVPARALRPFPPP